MKGYSKPKLCPLLSAFFIAVGDSSDLKNFACMPFAYPIAGGQILNQRAAT